MHHSKFATRRATLAAFFLATSAFAVDTRTWIEADYSDFEKGIIHNLSLRSDGRLSLAPRFHELYDTNSSYLWSLAHDSKGNLYAGGGPGAKLYRLSPKGDKKMLVELDGLEIHALAVDGQDRLYAATSPDGKVYRIAKDGKPEVYYDPKSKYIWAMTFDSKGDLFIATGDNGEIHRVTPGGKGSVFFRIDETHARSMAVDRNGNLIVGTEPGGLVVRISPAGEGFVLYQMSKREVTAVAAAADGSVWAAAVGTKQAAPPVLPPAAPVAVPSPAPTAAAGTTTVQVRPAAGPPPTLAGVTAVAVTGGSEVFRIDPDGNPRKMWTHAQDLVYAIAFDPDGRALLGTGNKGYIYRVDSPTLYTALLNGSSTQVTDFDAAGDGHLYAVTGNVGKIYEIGPGLEKEGIIESDVFDAGIFSRWGRLMFDGKPNSGQIRIAARSGNLDQPQKNWSPWSPPVTDRAGARVTCPPARFVQWKATLVSGGDSHSPELESVELAYLPKNIEPRLEEVEITPSNYKFPATSTLTASTQNITLQPLGKRSQPRTPSLSLDTGSSSMQYAKGWMGARWTASDENGDTLIYTVQIRGANETEWKLLKDDVREKQLSFDSTGFPDGEYRIRVIASDSPSNPPSDALTAQGESEPFLIDNTPPAIAGLAATRNGNRVNVTWKATDAQTFVEKAEYSLDGGEWTRVMPVGGLADSPSLSYDLTLENVAAGEHTIAVRVEDEYDNQSAAKVVVK